MAELIKKENNQVVFKFTVPAAAFDKAIVQAYAKGKGRFNIPGFRKGKAPQKMIEMQYGEGVFFEEAINIALPDAYEAAVKALELDTVDRPEIDILEIGKGQDAVIEATVFVKPEVQLGAYKGVSVEAVSHEISESDIEQELDKERNMSARMITIDNRPVQTGDTVVIDYAGSIDDVPFDGGTAQNHSLIIGSKSFIDTFEDQLIGKNTGDQVVVNVTFPEAYHAEHLAGKPAVFQVTINEIKYKEMPELDDEFAKDVSEFDTLEAFKASIREKLETAAKERSNSELRERVVAAVVENTQIELPAVMIESEIENMLMDFDYQLRYQGIDLENYLKYTNTTKEDLKERMQDDAANRVKTSLVIETIAKVEALKATEDEVEAELQRIADIQKSTLEKVKKVYARDDFAMIKGSVESRKTVDFLVANAIQQ